MKRIKSPIEPSLTRPQVEALIADLRQCAIREQLLNAERQDAIKKIDDKFAKPFADLNSLVKEKTAAVKRWAVEHPEAFGAARTICTIHGDFGFRTGMPAAEFLPGKKAPDILALLLARGLTDYIRTTQEVNRQALIADREKLGPENLQQLGVRIVQSETFFIAPKLETEAATAAAA